MYSARRWPQYGNADIYSAATKAKQYIDNSIKWLRGEWGSPASVDEVVVGTSEAKITYYDIYGRQVINPSGGIYIRRQGDEIMKVVM